MRKAEFQSLVITPALGWRDILSAYNELTKPGITMMVVMSAAVGYYLSLPKNSFLYLTVETGAHFFLSMIGTSLVSAGACVLNHVTERQFDAQMKRTMMRPIPSGRVPVKAAAIFGTILSAAGIGLLASMNVLGAVLAAATSVLYLAVYTPLKRKTQLSTLIGGIPGALPPLGGWVMGSGDIGLGGLVLFAILFCWQIPHFLSLAWMYRKDYEKGGFPILAVLDDSGLVVARHIVIYTLLLFVLSLFLSLRGLTGVFYFYGALVLGVGFLFSAIRFFFERSNAKARSVLLASYFYLLSLFTLMFLDKA